MTEEEIISHFMEDLWHSSDHVKKSRLHYARMWLNFAGGPPWERSKVIEFMEHLKKDGYAPGTQRLILSIVKRVFDAANERLEMGKRWLPEVSSRDVEAPPISIDRGQAMIRAAVEGKLQTDEAAFLALSSTFGLRREELRRMDPEFFDWKRRTVFIPTAKRGQEREHLIPAEIEPYLKAHDFSREYSLFDLSRMWWVIEAKAGLVHIHGLSWHSFKRSIDSELLNRGVPFLMVKDFLRWKGGSMGMPGVYYHSDAREIDQRCFEAHPFLPFWR